MTEEQRQVGGITECDRPHTIQLFGTASVTGFAPGLIPFTTSVPATGQAVPNGAQNFERLWRVRSSGLEVQRNLPNGAIPLTIQEIQQTADGRSRGGSGMFKVRVSVCSLSGDYEFFMDTGQAVEVYGYNVITAIFGPAGAFAVNPDNAANPLSGLLVDTMMGVSILAEEVAIGQDEVKFTEHFAVALNTQTTIPVPKSAVGIRVYTGTGAATTVWGRFLGAPALPGIRVGDINFAAGISSLESTPIGDETHLQTDIDALFDRSFMIVWTIRP